MFEFAKYEDREELICLWKTLYDDSDEYIRFSVDELLSLAKCAIIRENGIIIGAMYLLPATIKMGIKAQYWYAGGIKPEFRGKHRFNDLVDEIIKLSKKKKLYNVCVPAECLFDFYDKKGLIYPYICNRTTVFAAEAENKDIVISNAELSDINLGNYGYGDICYGEEFHKYIFRENLLSGGENYTFSRGGKKIFFQLVKCGERYELNNFSDAVNIETVAEIIRKLGFDKCDYCEKGVLLGKAYALTDFCGASPMKKFNFTLT